MEFKRFVLWLVLHTLSIILMTIVLTYLNLQNSFFVFLIFGFGVTTLANIYKTLLIKKQFVVNVLFVFYSLSNSLVIWFFIQINNAIGLHSIFLNPFLIAFGLVLSSLLIKKVRFRKKRNAKYWTVALILLMGLFILTWNYPNGYGGDDLTYSSFESKLGNLLNKIKSISTNSIELGCPQINVPMERNAWEELSIKGKTYDGWVVKGIATCKKGNQEGENLNRYYCGGYSSVMGIGNVNAYIEKTPITDSGEIGKTYKHVIWNIYDENKQFIETKCLGDPDEFERKQAEAWYNEILKWN